ncbi:MAG TPA: hypothetical protein VF580_05130 [Thermoanaerobaculia bacterium]
MRRTVGVGARGALVHALGFVAAALAVVSCARTARDEAADPARRSRPDALFLAKAPAVVPEELEADLASMGIGQLYVAAASVDAAGHLTPLPLPPAPLKSPVWLTIVGREGELVGLPPATAPEAWANALDVPLAEMRKQGNLAGIHLHLPCESSQAAQLATIASALRKKSGLPVSATIIPGADPERWKALEGAVDEVVAFAMGRRPETADLMVSELTEERAKAIPVPFRLLVVPGSYGFAGNASSKGRRILDGEVDRLSEDRNLDFDFGQVLSTEAGSLYNFKPRAGSAARSTMLAADGGLARFQVLSIQEIARFLSSAGSWTGTRLKGRVFLVDGLPNDGHLLGFEALRALLLGHPLETKLEVRPGTVQALNGSVEFSLKVSNTVPLPSELSRLGNWIRIRVEGGVVTSVAPGDFDRFELLASAEEGASPAPFGRASVCKLFENIFVPGESNDAGPIRVAGTHPRVFVGYHLVQTDGRTMEAPEVEIPLSAPLPETPPPARKPPARKLLRR